MVRLLRSARNDSFFDFLRNHQLYFLLFLLGCFVTPFLAMTPYLLSFTIIGLDHSVNTIDLWDLVPYNLNVRIESCWGRLSRLPNHQSTQEVNMRKVVWVVSILSVLVLVNFVHAQFGKAGSPKFYSEFKPVVGGWSEYQMRSKGEAPVKMSIAIVGKEGDAYWYENVMEGGREGKVISKMLVSGNPDDPKNVKRMIVKTGNRPAMELPVQMMSRDVKAREPMGKMVDKGSERIQVPAGTFTTQHLQYQQPDGVVDTWVHKDVSPYGMIKSQGKDFEMVLTGYGTGAKTQITEQPRRFEMPKMPPVPQTQTPKAPIKGKPPAKPQADEDDDDDEDDEEEDDDD